jgi:hypothetical protein
MLLLHLGRFGHPNANRQGCRRRASGTDLGYRQNDPEGRSRSWPGARHLNPTSVVGNDAVDNRKAETGTLP